jgi:hypothetical protein
MITKDLLIISGALTGLIIVATTFLHGWQGWLTLKTRELDASRPGARAAPEIEGGAYEGAARIEIADLKERIRKLEAIASGVDL